MQIQNGIDLSAVCAPGTRVNAEMFSVGENVSLRVMAFCPEKETGRPPVVFVAGLVSLVTSWEKVLREMTRDFRVYYVETREKVSSVAKGDFSLTIEAIGKDLVSLVSLLNLPPQKYILFGSSLGATAILDCCRFLKTPPLCLILIGPNAVFQIPKWFYPVLWLFPPRLYLLMKPFIRWYLRTFEMDMKSDAAQYEKYCSVIDVADPWKLKKVAHSMAKYSVWDRLDSIHYPAFIIGASKDKMHIPENLQKIAERMENAEYLDMGTNSNSHSADMVRKMREYLFQLKNG